jgi:thiaminase/transcriptional activator TenA
MGFSDQLRRENTRIWDAIMEHPFVLELGTGTLTLEKFTYYVKQDYLYLIDFARCIGLAASKADDVGDMRSWAEMMEGCLKYETEMLESLSEELGVPPGEIARTPKAPTNEAYTNHILRVAYEGSVGENVAALLPCMWTYMDVGSRLAEIGGYKGHPVYEEWCEAYNAPEYNELVDIYRSLVDRSADRAGDAVKDRMRHHFSMSMRYEYMFWEMAHRMEEWPVS